MWVFFKPSEICFGVGYILYVPLILQQIQISVDQPYAGPGCQLLHYQRDIYSMYPLHCHLGPIFDLVV
jgi:hypothetical protein